MPSRIDASLTSEERRILILYSDPKRYGVGRAARLSIQYALGTGCFAAVCILRREPFWVLAVYGVFLLFLIVRVFGARRVAGVMPGIIAKYEARIAELEASCDPAA